MLVALAGPASNILIALVFGLVIRLYAVAIPYATLQILSVVVIANLVLALFNLVPLPPLDGSKILFSLVPDRDNAVRVFIEKYGFVLTLFFVFFLWQYVAPVIYILFGYITGISLI
jgi:Zn-dependent protease